MSLSKTNIAALSPILLSVMRIVLGLMILEHGTTKHLNFPEHPMNAVTVASASGIAGLFELVLGVFLILGFMTRPAAFLMSGIAALAYWTVYAPKGFFPIVNGGESAVVYTFVFLYLAAAGAGPWSIDAKRGKA